MRNRDYAIVSVLFVILFGSIGISDAYAQELSYDEKLEFAVKIKEITGHMVSALDNISEEKYTLAKMHLIHPLAEHSDITDFLDDDSECFSQLPLVLAMLEATIPEFDKKVTEKRFSYAFGILSGCYDGVVEKADSNFTIDVIGKLLEESVEEYEDSTNVKGMGKIMEQQDALGLVIRAHMMIPSVDIFDARYTDSLKKDFKGLFIAHLNEEPLSEIAFMTSQILDRLGLDYTITHKSAESVSPVVYLKKVKYSNDLMMLELHGERFDAHQKMTIDYFSPISKKTEMINATSTSDGIIAIPFEFVDESFDESIMFSITIDGNDVLYEILSVE